MKQQQRNLISWFGTNKGRQFSFGIVSIAGIGISAGYFSSHTFLLQKYKEIVQMYGLGVEVPVSSKVKKRLEEVLDDMEVTQKERQYIKPFTVFGFDMFHAGCTQTRTGAVIGIPSNFSYESTSDVDRHQIRVNLDQVSWGSETGTSLLNAMVFSEDAQKFAMGREIAYVRSPYVYFQSIFPVSVITFIYAFTSNCNNRLHLLSRPLPLRLVMYSLAYLFGFGTWAFMQDFTTVYYEAESDKEMAAKGEKYVKGGIEFYSKILERNIALRTLMGSKGEQMFTATGNDQELLRRRHLPLILRKEYLKLQLEELKKTQQESANVSDQSWKTDGDTNSNISSPA